MRRMTLVVGTVSLLGLGAIGAIACGDDDSTGGVAPAPDAAGGTDGTAATSSSGTSGDPGSSSSSGGTTDGGTSSSSSSGDLPPSPGQLACGATTCDAGGGGGPGPNVCCQSATDANTKCARAFQCDNTGSNGALRLLCDDKADCEDGEVCCYVKDGNGGPPSFSTTCRNQCRGPGPNGKPRPHLCKTSAECGDAGACNAKTCDGFKLRVCGSPEGCQ